MVERYPDRICHRTASLDKSAERSLDHPPILLANHYRSHYQIASLCNAEGVPVVSDIIRDRFLKMHGWQIVRVPNHRILKDPGKAAAEIRKYLEMARLGLKPL